MATRRWIRITANLSLGAYEVFEAAANIPEPTWPDLSFPDLLKIAFRDRLVDHKNTYGHSATPGSNLMFAVDVCLRAADLVDGDRRRQYGEPQASHARVAALWSAYLEPPLTQHVAN